MNVKFMNSHRILMVFRKDIAPIGNPLDIRITHGSSLIIMPVRCRKTVAKIDLESRFDEYFDLFKVGITPLKGEE
ncbi:hypothetical protein BCT49_20765 [Vibrio lentus]|uniref:Uncharacterized protein n=1 Tax=Vibrio lentus TaxID=136468 RepID=A0A2N7KML2_9VIBR|nr:hypothetical protein BCT49_20765 [Vibrio lentus]